MNPEVAVLINTEIGAESDVLKELKKMENVIAVEAVYGVYDILARVRGKTMDEVKETVSWKIRKLDKVRSILNMTFVEGASFIRDDLLPTNSPDLKSPEQCAYGTGISFYEISKTQGKAKAVEALVGMNSGRISGAAINDFMLGYLGEKTPKEEHTSDGRNIVNVDYCFQICKLFDCRINEHPDNPKYKSEQLSIST
jgi:DNA-binding Lrp family transcriptional regulator